MSILEELRNDVVGVGLLVDWLGDGGEPVSQILAEHRAYACTHGDNGYPCKFNVEPGWWDKHVKEPIAETIRADLELKKRLRLHVSSEDALAMCKPCGCCMKLKIWTPLKHIRGHTPPEVFEKFPSWCWQRKEIEGA